MRKPKPVPAFSPRHVYGGTGTIHRTGTIDIQLDDSGTVTAVWFRCLQLPFTVSKSGPQPGPNPAARIAIEELTYLDLESE